MTIIDVIGKPCPIPVIESKKALATEGVRGVLVKVDNFVAVQNLEKMAKGLGYGFSFAGIAADRFEVSIGDCGEHEADGELAEQMDRSERSDRSERRDRNELSDRAKHLAHTDKPPMEGSHGGPVVVIGRDTMGAGEQELGKILIKGFIYALSELPAAPSCVIFFNSGAYLTAAGANTIDDLKKLEARGARILTCGTCVDYYNLQPPAAGEIANMYEITEIMANATNVINL